MTDETLSPESPEPSDIAPVPSRSMADILTVKKPNERQCRILLDPAIGHEIEETEREYQNLLARLEKEKRKGSSLASGRRREKEAMEEKLEELYDRAETAYQTFIFRDIGRKNFDEGVHLEENRPTPEDQKMWEESGEEGKLEYSPTNFPAWLIAACSADPVITIDEARTIVDEWSEGDVELLFFTAIAACKERTSLPFGRSGSGRTPGSASNSNSAESPGSPTLSSSNGESPTD